MNYKDEEPLEKSFGPKELSLCKYIEHLWVNKTSTDDSRVQPSLTISANFRRGETYPCAQHEAFLESALISNEPKHEGTYNQSFDCHDFSPIWISNTK